MSAQQIDDLFADQTAIWKSQEPVEFESIPIGEDGEGSKYSLSGQYHGYMTAGVGYTFLQLTVGGAEISEGSTVLVWAQIKFKLEEQTEGSSVVEGV